ncbi:MAG: hypothetical protein QMB88_00845 [Burkholderiaceae bacterium]
MNNEKRSVSRYLYIAAVAIISLAVYVWAVSSMANHQQSPYALDKVSETPIPKWDFFSLWNDSLASSCNTVAKQLGMKPQACRTAIVNKRMECYKHVGAQAPDQVGDTGLADDLSRKYIQCVTPYQYCQALSTTRTPLLALCSAGARDGVRSAYRGMAQQAS